jgi:hypothetical protein
VINKSLCTWWVTPLSQHTSFLPHYLAQSDCLVADCQSQGDTKLTLKPSIIPNSNYVIMVSDWNSLKNVCVFFFGTVIIRCTKTFWSPCISQKCTLLRVQNYKQLLDIFTRATFEHLDSNFNIVHPAVYINTKLSNIQTNTAKYLLINNL